MKVAVAASPEVAIPTLEYLLASEYELALVISRPDSQTGRGRELNPTAVSNWAIANQIELYRPNRAADFDDRLKKFDLVIYDDIYPHPVSGFRLEEFTILLSTIKNSKILLNPS